MTTKIQLIEQYKLQNPILTKRVNGEDIQLDSEEYESTIELWADATLEKQARLAAAEQTRQDRISAYQKLGLSEAEIEALLPTPRPKSE